MKPKINVALASRVKNLPPYLFATIDRMKQETKAKGVDLIDLSIGDPDIPTPVHIVEAMKSAVGKPELRAVATCTRDRLVPGNYRVVVEPAAECDCLGGRRIIRRDRNWWQPQ